MKTSLSIHTGFCVNRFIEPEVFTKLIGNDLGLDSAQLTADLINPFYPDDYIEKLIYRINEACKKYNVTYDSIMSGTYTRVTHLCHPDEECRKIWLDWFKKLIDIGEKLGSKVMGSQFALFSESSFNDLDKREFLLEESIKNWQELASYAKEKGYVELLIEPMSIPREYPHTIDETISVINRLNNNSALNFAVCLDIGHAPHPDERDPYLWMEKVGDISPQLHVHQTVLHKSNHSPFTKAYNENGIIKADKVIKAMEKSGAKETRIVLEISHKEHYDTEFKVIKELKESVDYWRPYITN